MVLPAKIAQIDGPRLSAILDVAIQFTVRAVMGVATSKIESTN
jgi:hypothetical protein